MDSATRIKILHWEDKLAEIAADIIDKQEQMDQIKLVIDLLKKHEVK